MESDKERLDESQQTAPDNDPSDGEDAVETREEAGADTEGTDAENPGEELEGLRARCTDLEEALLRTRAEMDNLRKRSQREVEQARRFALERFMGELLEVHDSLERGLAAASSEADIEQLREGKALTLRLLRAALEKHGLVEIDPQDQPFDPERHEAISMAAVPGVDANTVIDVVQKGYALNDRLLRPARVVVASEPPTGAKGG